MKKIINSILCFALVWLAITPIYLMTKTHPETTDNTTEVIINEQGFDTSALYEWCGEHIGALRMVGAWAHDRNTLEDETGALWGYDELEENAFYLLWIDDMGTSTMEDDIIVKVWQEK